MSSESLRETTDGLYEQVEAQAKEIEDWKEAANNLQAIREELEVYAEQHRLTIRTQAEEIKRLNTEIERLQYVQKIRVLYQAGGDGV